MKGIFHQWGAVCDLALPLGWKKAWRLPPRGLSATIATLLASGLLPLSLRASVELVPLTNTWRFEQTTNLDGVTWWSPGYDDSNWPTGKALLYVESNVLVSPRNTSLTIGRTTYYFRSHFQVPFPLTNAFVAFSSRIDDGAVFYINGREVQRVRLPAAPAAVSYATLASGTPSGGDAINTEMFTLPEGSLTNFVSGDNVLAVEVHQNVTTSDDVVFGTAVTWRFTNAAPVVITQPAAVSVLDGRPAALVAIVDGDPTPTLQWFKGNAPISGATNSTLGFSAAYLTNDGSYSLMASNTFGTVTTSNALLSVLADTNTPAIVSALAQKNLTNIVVSFSEPVHASSAADTNNYAIFQTALPSNHLDVLGVSLSGNSAVVLQTTSRVAGLNYSLRVNRIQDISSVSNAIAPDSTLALSYQVDLIAVDAATTWRYFQQGLLPATNWMATNYDDSNWPQGAAVFAGGSPAPSTTDPIRTTLALTAGSNAVVTYYFRTLFDLPGLLSAGTLRLREIADDGAIFHLNGSEVFSVGMPVTRPVNYQTSASRTVGTAAYEPSLSLPGWSLSESNLMPLRNCFTVELHQRTNSLADAAFAANLEAVITCYQPRLQLSVPAVVQEGAGTLTNQAQLSILEALQTNLVIQVSSTHPADVATPAEITIPAGATNVSFNLTIGDDALFNGPRSVLLTAQVPGVLLRTTSLLVLDNETNTIQLVIAPSTTETNGSLSGEIRFGQPAGADVTVSLASSDLTELIVPASVIVPAGATSTVFQVTVLDDLLLDGPQTITLSASVAGWPTGFAELVVADNEPRTITVTLPATVLEGAGTLVSAGRVQLAGVAVSNLTVALSSSLPELVSVASNATVNAGQSNAVFDLKLVDNTLYEPPRVVVIIAAISGFTTGSNTVTVLDDDADHFGFSMIGSPQDTATPFNVTVTAQHPNGSVVTNFKYSVGITANALEGNLPVEPATIGPFISGQWSGTVRVTAPGRLVRLSCPLAPGESNPFHVEPPPFRILAQPAADLAFHTASGALFASVPATGGIYSNKLIVINPFAATVTNSYPLGDDPGQIELSPNGQFLYTTVSNRLALRRFDLTTRQAGLQFGVGSFFDVPNGVTDFTVLAGASDSVCASTYTTFGGNYGGVWRFNGGSPVNLDTFSAAAPYWIESSPSSQTLYGYQNNNQYPLMRGLAQPGSALVVSNGVIGGGQITYRSGVLYNNAGRAVVADTFVVLGDYPNVIENIRASASVDVDPVLKRTFFLSGYVKYGASFYKLKAYDRDSFVPLGQLPIPTSLMQGGAGRLLRWSTNGLVFNTGSQIWFVQSGLLQPTYPAADLVLTQSAVPLPAVLGTNVAFMLTLSNAGPGLATFIRVSNALPANAVMVGSTPTVGTVTQSTNTVIWNLTQLEAGSNATLLVSLRFGTAGWQTNTATAVAYEADPDFANNISRLGLYVQLPPEREGAFALQYSAEDMVYDPVRDRLLLSVGTGIVSQNNGIAVLNPYQGTVDSFASLGKHPTRLARSDDGRQLYVSLPDDARVRRLTLTNFQQNLEFSLGGTYTYNSDYLPFFAADLAAVPGAPNSLVVWRMSQALYGSSSGGHGIAVYDNGIARSNTAFAGGTFSLEFDTDAGTLYAFNAASDFWSKQGLYRCELTTNGVTNSPALFPEGFLAGQYSRYALGRMFSTQGRVAQLQPPMMEWAFPGGESTTLVKPDAASGRVYYLVQDNGWRIKAYDIESYRALGNIAVTNVVGTPTSLIRWGTNGLAFRTTGGQVFIVRTPLVQPSAAADIAVEIDGPDAPVATGSEALLTLSLTNRGPASAQDVVLMNSFSPAVEIVWTFCTEGSCLTTNGQIVWRLPRLDLGQDSFAAVGVRSMQTGAVSVAANVISAMPDPRVGDNAALRVLQVGAPLDLDRVTRLQISANDLAWSPSLGRLLLTATTNTPNWSGSLLSVDPLTLVVRFESTLGNDAGRLAVSRDDGMLYAGVDYGVNALTLPDLAIVNRFLINPTDPRGVAYDLEVVPSANQSVVVGSRSRSNNSTWLGAYDSGIQRTNTDSFYTTGFSLEYGDDPSLFYYQDYSYGGFRRYVLSEDGLRVLDTDSTLLPSATAIELKWADGLLYTSVGIVIDPATRKQLRTIPGITNNGALCYDAVIKRVFFLMPAGTNAVLYAVDALTTVPLGARLVTGLGGISSSLVRWGADGLACRSTGGQIALLRSSLVPSDSPADLEAAITSSGTLAFVGSNFVYTVIVTNQGPAAATNAQIALRVPANVNVTGVLASQGGAAIGAQQALANLGTLSAGATARVDVTVVVTQPGRIEAVASTTSSALDPDLANNSCSLTNSAVLFVARDAVVTLNQAAADLVFNPSTGRLYASGNPNSITVINPALSQVENNWPVPTQPGRLALSDDGQALYVALNSDLQLARLRTADGMVLTNFPLGTNASGAAFALVDLEVIPGAPNSVVVNEEAGGMRYLAVMDESVARPAQPQVTYGSYLEFGSDPTVIYLSGLLPMALSTNGISVLGDNGLFSSTSDFKFDHGLFYTDAGEQVNANDHTFVTRFTGLGTGTLVAPEIAHRRVYFLTKISTSWQLRAYDPVTTDLVGSQTITNVLGTPSALLRWGDDGLAFCTTSNQVFLLRPSFVPGGPAADLQLTQTPTPSGPVARGSNVTFVVQITNAGPSAASSVLLLNPVPTNTTLVQVQLSQGTTNFSGGLLTCALGTITNGGTAQISLTLRPQHAGALVSRATATSANLDPDSGNNTVTTSVGVQLGLPPDAVGVVGLQTSDIEYDPVSGLIYASLTDYLGAPYENGIVSIDPATGLLGNPIPVAPKLSNLVVTDDGSRLYVLANSATEFRRVNIPTGASDLRVVTAATEIKAVPGQPRSLAVVPGTTGVVVYDDSVPRLASLGWYDRVEFFATNRLLGFWSGMYPTWTARLVLTTNGVTVDSGNATYLVDGTMRADAGLIYTSGGSVIDPMALAKLGSFGVSGLVAPDSTVNRVYFLTPGGSAWVLRCFDQQTRVELGSLTLTNVLGTPTKLLRCGAERLAFRTSAGQVFVLRTSFIPSGPPADLALIQSANPNPVFIGSNLLYTIEVTNNGPYAATNVIISDVLPPSAAVVSANATSGAVSNYGGNVICRLNLLTNGGSVAVTVVVTPSQIAPLTNIASVTSSSIDPVLTNNSSALTTAVAYQAGPNSIHEINLSVRDMVYDPISRRIYASGVGLLGGAGSSVFPVNPENGMIEKPIPVGNNPGPVAVSDDGQYLHVGLDGSSAIRRINLQTRTPDLLFSIGDLVDVQDLVALSGSPATVAVSRRWLGGNPVFHGVQIYDNGVARSNAISSHTGPNAIEPGAGGSVLYGYNQEDSQGGFYRMTVDASGASLLDMTVGLIPAFTGDIVYGGGRIYTTDGLVINPTTLTTVGSFADIPHASPLTVDSATQQAFYFVPNGPDVELRIFRSDTRSLQGTMTITNISGSLGRPIRCGADRLAFATTAGQLFVIRTSLIPSADLMVFGSLATNQVMVGETLSLQLTVSNAGPYAVTGVLLTNILPQGFNLVSATLSQGTVSTNGWKVVAAFGALGTNAGAVLNLVLSPTAQALGAATNSAELGQSSLPDPITFNNHVALNLLVLPADTDHDGMPDNWELAYGLNPTNALDATFDSDCDGLANLQEYLAGRNPLLFENMRLASPRLNAPGQLEATLVGAPGKVYTLEASTNLVDWQSVATVMCQTENQRIQIPISPMIGASFFRLRTDTKSAHPVLTLLSGPLPLNSPPLIRVAAPPGRLYSLQASTNLVHWTTISNYFGINCTTVITDPTTDTSSTRFYRILLP